MDGVIESQSLVWHDIVNFDTLKCIREHLHNRSQRVFLVLTQSQYVELNLQTMKYRYLQNIL